MKQFILFIGLCFFSLTSSAIEAQQAVKTSTEGGRYEIVQSEIARKYFFKLDKYTGNVYQLVKKSNGDVTWEKMLVIGLALDTIKEDAINFQIFMGGIAVSDCFMINIHTGKTYQLFCDKTTDELFWGYIIENNL
jgi:hypothetical protein